MSAQGVLLDIADKVWVVDEYCDAVRCKLRRVVEERARLYPHEKTRNFETEIQALSFVVERSHGRIATLKHQLKAEERRTKKAQRKLAAAWEQPK